MSEQIINQKLAVCQPPLVEKQLAHRNHTISGNNLPKEPYETPMEPCSYGVPMNRKMLTCELYNRRFDEIRHYLYSTTGLTRAEVTGILRLLRIYAYYGKVYCKASQIATDFENMTPGCSKRSFWRGIAKLEEQGLIQVINRYLHSRQISNCYRMDKLILCLVRFLLEHGPRHLNLSRLPREIRDALQMANFWRVIRYAKADLSKAIPVQI
ncbi:hypothetical protein ES705_18393 [subsurface metagenome]